MTHRTPLIAGNWKMHKACSEAAEDDGKLKKFVNKVSNKVTIAPTYSAFFQMARTLEVRRIAQGVQDMNWELQGAFNGKISTQMLTDAGCNNVIIGHSERRQYFEKTSAHRKRRQKYSVKTETVFASMPFDDQYDDTFLVAIQPAALAFNATTDRVDRTGGVGEVVGQIKTMIEISDVVIADLSESRPNVCHEVGYAAALKKPIIQICSTSLEDLPFNLRNNQTIPYKQGQTTRLRSKLEKELAKLFMDEH